MEVKSDIMKIKEEPLVDKEYLLEKFPGKGGWTYALIPKILQDKHSHFGWVIVNGSIDVKNGADCYSKIGHAVTVLRWQS